MQNAVDTNTHTQLHGLITERSVEFTFIAPSKSHKTVGGGLLASWGGLVRLAPPRRTGLACPLKKADLRSLDFVIDRLFMKLFRTNNMDTVRYCQTMSAIFWLWFA